MILFSAITNAEDGSFDSFDVDINEEIRLEFEENERIRIAQQNIVNNSDSSSNEISIIDSSSNENNGSVSVKKGYDPTYWENIEYFGLTPVFTIFPGPFSPVSKPTKFIGIDIFLEGLDKVQF